MDYWSWLAHVPICPSQPSESATPEPGLNVDAEWLKSAWSELYLLVHNLRVDIQQAPVVSARMESKLQRKFMNEALALIQQVSDQRVREFAADVKRTNILAGLPAEATTVILTEDFDQALLGYLSHKEVK